MTKSMMAPRKGSIDGSTLRLLCLGMTLAGLALSASLVVEAKPFTKVNATTVEQLQPTVDHYYDIPWEADIFHLPAEVPFPGGDWLHRVVAADLSSSSSFTFRGVTYSSAYAAMLENRPLDFPCRNFNAYLNSIFFRPSLAKSLTTAIVGATDSSTRLDLAHYVLCYLRNLIGAMLVYYGTALIFHYFCYVHQQSKAIFEDQGRPRPSWTIIWDQIQLAQSSMMLYVLLPCVDEFLIEAGLTKVYYTVAEIGGWPRYVAMMVLYFACVEVGIYWMHRTLHTNKWMYRHIHLMHHKYNKPETLTPWASIAFHPLDGILQASPYVATLPLVPCHYTTHFGLLFFTAIWATYIHDAMDWNVWHIMGSKYHTVHHTHYIYNYGQVFTFCDRWWGTFREPAGPTGVNSSHAATAAGGAAAKESRQQQQQRSKPNMSGRVGRRKEL